MPTVFENSSGKPQQNPLTGMEASDSMHLFTCYARRPKKVRFETQESDEHVILFLRQHFIVNVPWIFLAIVFVLSPATVFPFIFSMFELPGQYVFIGTLFWYLATFGFVLVKFLGWYFNIYIVTNERVVDIDFINLLVKRFSQAELSRIQNITYSTQGIMATFFHYGNVVVETAGDSPNIECVDVPNPDKVVEQIRTISAGGGQKL